MSDYLQIKFPYYRANIESKLPIGEITLYDYLYSIKNPKPHIESIFLEIEKASLAGDKKLKTELKSKLFYFTPCINTDGLGRSYENITAWTGLMLVDIDNLEVEFAKELKQHLFETYPFIIASFLSASKKGVKALVRIPVCNSVDEFKSYYYGLMDDFQNYLGIDTSSKNCSLPNYLTYDKDLLYRIDTTIWNKKGIQLDEFKAFEGEIEPLKNISEEDVLGIKRMIRNMMLKIDLEQTGHVICRSSALLLGGYVGTGYLEFEEAQDYMFDLVDEVEYCQKSPKTYKQTIVQMLKKGASAPLIYER